MIDRAPDEAPSTNEAENQAIAELQATLKALTESLYSVDEARYAEPSGGYRPGL